MGARPSVDTSRPSVDTSRPSVDTSRPSVDDQFGPAGVNRPLYEAGVDLLELYEAGRVQAAEQRWKHLVLRLELLREHQVRFSTSGWFLKEFQPKKPPTMYETRRQRGVLQRLTEEYMEPMDDKTKRQKKKPPRNFYPHIWMEDLNHPELALMPRHRVFSTAEGPGSSEGTVSRTSGWSRG